MRIHFLSEVFGMLSSKNFATMATWGKDFSSPSENVLLMIIWNLEFWALESWTQLKESGIPLTIENRNPFSCDKECRIQLLETRINAVESRMQD